jgi:signal transduction histidine kinase
MPVHWTNDGYQYLPEMTALFIEGLAREPENKQICSLWPNLENNRRILKQWIAPRPPATAKITASILPPNELIIPIDDKDTPDAEVAPNEKIRTFMCGISNCFNNIFTGIWGNISLIRMNKNAPESIHQGMQQIERLILHGSVLIHIVFGYLAESRTEAKHIRLNQLLQEINEANIANEGGLDSKTIESCMHWASSLTNPARLSRSIARVIEKLLCWIDREHKLVLIHGNVDNAIGSRLAKIDALIERGFELTGQLRQYSGDTTLVRKRMRVKSLIKRILKQIELSRHGICLEADLVSALPDILADRSQLANALKHLIQNAIDAMPEGGRLKVSARPISKEISQERLFTRPGIEYIVITISDNGDGMAPHVQSRIFDPFYIGNRKPNQLGLGLAVASGIVKAHDGYIQVSSHRDRGSTFRIYLPCPRQNQSEAVIGRANSGRPDPQRVHAALASTTR